MKPFNGVKAVKKIDAHTDQQFLCSTNHVHLPSLKPFALLSMKNSLERYQLISETLDSKEQVSQEDLKQLLSEKYPDGLCCHFYDEFFGTLRSMIFDVNDGTLNICFGSPAMNSWYTLAISEKPRQEGYPVKLEREKSTVRFLYHDGRLI